MTGFTYMTNTFKCTDAFAAENFAASFYNCARLTAIGTAVAVLIFIARIIGII